jgi:hypothetical protein
LGKPTTLSRLSCHIVTGNQTLQIINTVDFVYHQAGSCGVSHGQGNKIVFFPVYSQEALFGYFLLNFWVNFATIGVNKKKERKDGLY